MRVFRVPKVLKMPWVKIRATFLNCANRHGVVSISLDQEIDVPDTEFKSRRAEAASQPGTCSEYIGLPISAWFSQRVHLCNKTWLQPGEFQDQGM